MTVNSTEALAEDLNSPMWNKQSSQASKLSNWQSSSHIYTLWSVWSYLEIKVWNWMALLLNKTYLKSNCKKINIYHCKPDSNKYRKLATKLYQYRWLSLAIWQVLLNELCSQKMKQHFTSVVFIELSLHSFSQR